MATGVQRNHPTLVAIPGLKSNLDMSGRLLRRPRPPKALPKVPRIDSTKMIIEEEDFPFSSPSRSRLQEIVPFHSSPTPSLASPPPSERLNAIPRQTYTGQTIKSSGMRYIRKEDKRYVIDPLYRDKTIMGKYVDEQILVKPRKPKGPDGLRAKMSRMNPVLFHDFCDYSEENRYYDPPAFTLQTFLHHVSSAQNIPVARVREIIYSRHNYKKLTKLLSEQHINRTNQNEVHQLELTPEGQNVPEAERRIPQRQLLIEMASVIKQHIREIMNTEVKTVIRPLPKYNPSYKPGTAPHTEIVLYEDGTTDFYTEIMNRTQETEAPGRDAIFHSERTRYFQGAGRSNSPFTAPDEGAISPCEMAMLDSLLSGGAALSLKAHFISGLPDMSPLRNTMTYLNLSFNDFSIFPVEILGIDQLEILKLRNNPLLSLPQDIHRLRNLRTLTASFCLISELPLGLFQLRKLQHLDISYNRIEYIAREISHLSDLQELNLEGNQLPAMSSGALRLNLRSLNVKNNFMHPLFWKENTRNQPQRLVDIAATTLHKSALDLYSDHYPDAVQRILDSSEICDCCRGSLYGPGLWIIRPVDNLFGVKNLPFLFRACSPSCLRHFKRSTDTLTKLLYGDDEDDT